MLFLCINKEGRYGEKEHYHDLGKDLFLQIPTLLANPILVFQNKDENDNLIKDNIVVVVNAVDKYNNQLIVPIKIQGDTGNNLYIEPNVIKSVYGKENYQKYINKNVSKKNILFYANKKVRNFD